MNGSQLIVRAGGHGRSVAEAVLLGGAYELGGFVDDGWEQAPEVWGYTVFGGTNSLEAFRYRAETAIVAIGNNSVRELLHMRLPRCGFGIATIIYPKAIVSSSARLGAGATVMAGAITGTEAQFGEGVIVTSGATVDHDCTVEDFGHLGVNACMAGGSILGRGAWLQAGSALGYGVRVPPADLLKPGDGRG